MNGARRSRILVGVGAKLGSTMDQIDHLEGVARGQLHGVEVVYRVGEEHDEEHLYTAVAVPMPRLAFELDVMPRVPLGPGEVGFEDAFVIEAAPNDVARVLLSPGMCARLLREHPVHARAEHDAGWLHVVRNAWDDEAASATHLIALAVELAQAIPRAFDEADEAIHARAASGSGGPYRGDVDPSVQREAADQRRRELAALADSRVRRQVNAKMARLLGQVGSWLDPAKRR